MNDFHSMFKYGRKIRNPSPLNAKGFSNKTYHSFGTDIIKNQICRLINKKGQMLFMMTTFKGKKDLQQLGVSIE